MRARRLTVVAAGVLAAVVVAAGVAVLNDRPRLRWPGAENRMGYGLGVWHVGADEPVTDAGSLLMCLDRPGQVTITDVSFEYTVGGLRVDAFAVQPAESTPVLSGDREPLWVRGFRPGAVTVDRQCSDERYPPVPQSMVRLGVQYAKPTAATARGMNLLIEYESEGWSFTLRSEVEVVLCEGDGSQDEWAEECATWSDVERYRSKGRVPY